MRRDKDPFSFIEANGNYYREPKEPKEPKYLQTWESDRYDFNDQAVYQEYVPEERCTVGACMNALRKSWISIKRANEGKERKNENEPVTDIMARINRIQKNLGIEPFRFQELEDQGYYDEQEEDEARQIAWGNKSNDNDDRPIFSSREEAEAWQEERAEEEAEDNWNNW